LNSQRAGDPVLLASRVRSRLEETYHTGAVAVLGRNGSLLAYAGDIDTSFYLRSSAKPFQAFISQESGAKLEPLELAMASASHRGHPVHVALVESMLEKAGLDESALQCPEAWPLSPDAARRLHLGGESRPRRIWHNCSGKHAGFLRACVGSGWPIESYLAPDHPLQRRIIEFVSELGGHPVVPVGVDGCGAPVLRTTTRAMSLLFSHLAFDHSLRGVFEAMHRYPSLIGSNGEGDSTIAMSLNAAAKGGAQGCIGVALEGRLGVAVKSWDGLGDIANAGAVAALDELGELTLTARSALAGIARPAVLGGGMRVGEATPRLELTR
jgi:L-asparaginase II